MENIVLGDIYKVKINYITNYFVYENLSKKKNIELILNDNQTSINQYDKIFLVNPTKKKNVYREYISNLEVPVYLYEIIDDIWHTHFVKQYYPDKLAYIPIIEHNFFDNKKIILDKPNNEEITKYIEEYYNGIRDYKDELEQIYAYVENAYKIAKDKKIHYYKHK